MTDAVADPEAYTDSTYRVYASPLPSSDTVKLKDGRLLHRYSHPIVDPGGKVRGRTWYFQEIARQELHETDADTVSHIRRALAAG